MRLTKSFLAVFLRQRGYNNYQPTPLTGEAADQVLQKLEERSQSISE